MEGYVLPRLISIEFPSHFSELEVDTEKRRTLYTFAFFAPFPFDSISPRDGEYTVATRKFGNICENKGMGVRVYHR